MKTLQKIVRQSDLPNFCGLGRTRIADLIRQGLFPKPVKLSARRKAWLESELIAWQQDRIAERDRAA